VPLSRAFESSARRAGSCPSLSLFFLPFFETIKRGKFLSSSEDFFFFTFFSLVCAEPLQEDFYSIESEFFSWLFLFFSLSPTNGNCQRRLFLSLSFLPRFFLLFPNKPTRQFRYFFFKPSGQEEVFFPLSFFPLSFKKSRAALLRQQAFSLSPRGILTRVGFTAPSLYKLTDPSLFFFPFLLPARAAPAPELFAARSFLSRREMLSSFEVSSPPPSNYLEKREGVSPAFLSGKMDLFPFDENRRPSPSPSPPLLFS